MNTGIINLFWSCVSFLKFAKLRKQKWGVEYHDYYRIYPQGLLGAQLSLRRDPISFHNLRFQALTPFMFIGKDGVKQYAKYRTMPLDKAPETGITLNMSPWDTCNQRILPHEVRGRNYLKDEYKHRIANGGADYLMQIQLRIAKDDDNPEVFNNMKPWDENIYPWQDLAIVEINEVLDWKESLKTSFSLNNMPKNLGIIPAKSVYDYNSLNYMRSHSEIARKARLFSYKVFGYPPEIPDDDNRNVSDWSGKE
jgi:arachidonate 5-lipoxygenase